MRRIGILSVAAALAWTAGIGLLLGGSSPAWGTNVYSWSNFAGQPGGRGNLDGTGSAARFCLPRGVAVDSAGNVYVADNGGCTIRKVTPSGQVTTLAGGTSVGSTDGTGSAARFHNPGGVAVDSAGNVYVADSLNHTIRKVTPSGAVTTVAGLAGTAGSDDGTGSAARFNYPSGVAVDSAGNVYVADCWNNLIRKMTPAGVVTTLAGGFSHPSGVAVDSAGNVYVADTDNHTIRKVTQPWVVTTLAGLAGSYGSTDGTGSAARFYKPSGVAVDSAGNVYVGDYRNHTIRKVTPAGVVTTLAGLAGSFGTADGMGSDARFYYPYGVAGDSAGNVYVGDSENHTIRKVTPAGAVTTLAGWAIACGSADGTGNAARFWLPYGVAAGSSGNVYVGDSENHTIRKVTPAGVVTTLAGLAGTFGSTDGTGSAARFYYPGGVATDSEGNLYVADSLNRTIRKVTPAGAVTTLAGGFSRPWGVAVDGAGNVYVADLGNYTIRKVTPTGVVTTLAGLAGTSGSTDGTGSAARFGQVYHVAVDNAGNVYAGDWSNHTIRKVTPSGVVTTLAGRAGSPGSADGTGSAARFYYPGGVAVDSAGNLYVADYGNQTIRKMTPGRVVTTIGGAAGVMGGADGVGSLANFSCPWGIAVDSAGDLYVADYCNNRISKGTPQPTGDIDGNWHVNVVDLLILADSFGKRPGDSGYDSRCDLNSDDSVDLLDLLILSGNWGGVTLRHGEGETRR